MHDILARTSPPTLRPMAVQRSTSLKFKVELLHRMFLLNAETSRQDFPLLSGAHWKIRLSKHSDLLRIRRTVPDRLTPAMRCEEVANIFFSWFEIRSRVEGSYCSGLRWVPPGSDKEFLDWRDRNN